MGELMVSGIMVRVLEWPLVKVGLALPEST